MESNRLGQKIRKLRQKLELL